MKMKAYSDCSNPRVRFSLVGCLVVCAVGIVLVYLAVDLYVQAGAWKVASALSKTGAQIGAIRDALSRPECRLVVNNEVLNTASASNDTVADVTASLTDCLASPIEGSVLRDPYGASSTDELHMILYVSKRRLSPGPSQWSLFCTFRGPDGDFDSEHGVGLHATMYDPTNGIKSGGDVMIKVLSGDTAVH